MNRNDLFDDNRWLSPDGYNRPKEEQSEDYGPITADRDMPPAPTPWDEFPREEKWCDWS